ncbi:MAG: hypothetical protein K0R31_733 [Clostridiales bacterium]|jgi:putative tricarboxylic transport membrane protein|nr:hypothetical protein [Clostridiales bacterium]
MEVLQNLMMGLNVASEPVNILYCFIGCLFGIVIGALPGLGPSAGIAILLPLTYGVTPVTGIILLAGIYYGAMYGGSITSILINTPGDSASVMTTLDGYAMAKNGRAGAALGISAFGSLIGGTICIIIFMYFAPWLAKYAITFGPPEYFALMALGLIAISGMTGKYPAKGYLAAVMGLFFATVGLDLVQGVERFTLGSRELYDGIDFIPVAMGLFGITELIVAGDESLEDLKVDKKDLSWRGQLPTKEDWKHSWPHILQGTGVGFGVGMLPGAGATIASFMSYSIAKKTSKRGHLFGTGMVEGVAAPETANNAASMGTMVPLLALGLPGSASATVMLGALMMFGLQPGPMLFEKNPDFVWGLIGSMYIGNIAVFISVMIGLPLFVKILRVKKPMLNSFVMAFILIGSYCLNNSMFDVGMTIFFGALGYFMNRLSIPNAPLVLALVLGTMLENSLRQSLIMSRGDIMIIFTRPISGVIIWITIIMLFLPLIRQIGNMIKKNKESHIKV